MLTNPSRPATIAALSGVAVLLAGCQSYQSRPLDLAAHHAAWVERTPGDEPVRAFADRLRADAESPGFDLTDGLHLAEAEVVALVYNPDLRLARLRTGVSAAAAEHAGLWEDPTFGLDFLSLTENAANPLQISPGLALTIPISGRLEAEQARANAATAAELAGIVEQEWQTRIRVREAWLRWSAAELRAEQTERLLTSIGPLVASASRLAEAGEIDRTEAALFAIEQAGHRQALLRFRGEAAETEQELRMLMGVPPAAPLDPVPTIAAADAPPAVEPDAAGHPTLVRLRAEYEAAEQTLRREVREQYPDLTIGPLAESDRGDTLLGFSLALPIPILNANRQGIAVAHAERELARAAFETAYERLSGSLAAARVRLDALREQISVIESEIVPLVDRQLGDATRLLELGEGGSLVLLETLTRAGQTRMALIDARLAESLALVRIAELTGPPAPPSTRNPRTDTDDPEEPNPDTVPEQGDAAREVNP